MPLLATDDQMSLSDRGSMPAAAPQDTSTTLDLAAAVERRSNLAGTLYERYTNPAPDAKAVPGFDPSVSIPKGYESVAPIFANATSPEDIEWRRAQYEREQADNRTIAAHGGWGVASSMAAGLTDPVSIASMAIPVAGETRLAQAARFGLTAGATTAAQEAALQQLEVSRTAKDSALNIAAGTVLGGVLGAAIRPHVPNRSFDSLASRYHEELHGEGGETVMGPMDGRQRIIPEESVKPSAPHPESGVLDEHPDVGTVNKLAREANSEGVVAVQEKGATASTPVSSIGIQDAFGSLKGGGVSEDLRNKLWEAHRDGRDTVAGIKDPILKGAKQYGISTTDRAEFDDFIKNGPSMRPAPSGPAPIPGFAFNAATPEELAAHTKGAQASMAERLKATAPKPVMPDVPQSIGEMHVNPEAESTAGAAAAVTPTMRGESIARGAETLSDTLGRVSPGARLMNSPSIESRKLVQELANIPETLTKNYDGTATASPIERELWKYDGVHNQGMQARGEQYRTYRERIAGEGGAPLERGPFNHEIAKAMRRGDAHAIPEVAEAAKKTRAIEFEPLKARAIKAGLLPADVKPEGADSYLMRQYDAPKIRENLTDWLKRLKDGFSAQGVDPAEAADIAHRATRNIMGSERGTMDWKVMDDIVPKSGQLKERTLKLPDTLLEPYLNNDIDHVAHSYLRSMAPEVEMTERFGDRSMEGRIGDVHDDYARMIERAKDDPAKEKLSKQMDADLRDLTAVRDRLYGIYGQPKDPGHFAVRAGRLLRTVNALRLLGGATLAHFPDMANVMMRFGLPQTFSAIGKVLTSPGAFSLTRSEAKRMGAGLDMSMNATASMLGDYATHSQYGEQRVGQYLARKFTILTGETPLITAVQQLTSTMAQDTLVRTAQKVVAGKSVSKDLLARMAAGGIDQDLLERIASQHEKFGAKVNGLNFGMSDQWADKAAASAFESAILRDAHSVTLRPGVGDTPLFMSTEWGKALRQFTTFGYAAQRSVVNPLMQGLAHGDPRAATALFALAGMGTLSYVAKQTAAGQPIEDPQSARFALEVLDKSNLMGWTSDVVFPALWAMGFKNLSRWSDRDPVETLGGPVAGTVAATYAQQLPGKALASMGMAPDDQKSISRADLHFLRRLMPGQNLWFARNGINQLEDAVGDAFDLSGKSNADRAEETASNTQ